MRTCLIASVIAVASFLLFVFLGSLPPNMPILCYFCGAGCPVVQISGYVAPGYENVKEVFAKGFERGHEVGSQVTAFVDGVKVVDLVGGYLYRRWYTELYQSTDLQMIFSSTKVAESLVIAMLVDRGFLDYDERVAKYWPEFGSHGKENITVAQLMSHQAGLAVPNRDLDFDVLRDPQALSAYLVAQEPTWPIPPYPPAKLNIGHSGYHSCTRGLYASQLVRRVDPKGRTLAEFFADEVVSETGMEFYIGMPAHVRHRKAPMYSFPGINFILNTVLRLFVPNEYDHVLWDRDPFFTLTHAEEDWIMALLDRSVQYRAMNVLVLPDHARNWLSNHLTHAMVLITTNDFIEAELPSQNGVTTAHDLARTGAIFANGGIEPVSGKRLLRPETIAKAQYVEGHQFDVVLLEDLAYTAGGLGWTDEDIGWGGMGGSLIRWSHESNVVFAYVPSQLGLRVSARDPRSCPLKQAVFDAAHKLKNDSFVPSGKSYCI